MICFPVSTEFDKKFEGIQALSWLPWVGEHFPARALDKRLLVVGESHYVFAASDEELAHTIKNHYDDPLHTRAICHKVLVARTEPNRTMQTIPKLLCGASRIDHARLWADAAYYNFIQRPMHFDREGGPERPGWEDFKAGWTMFLEVIRLLQPSHCLFLGVSAANSFHHAMTSAVQSFTGITVGAKIGRSRIRTARLYLSEKQVELIFVQHPGRPMSWIKWHDGLRHGHPEFMEWMAAENYVTDDPRLSGVAL
jgi:hypothetical protein